MRIQIAETSVKSMLSEDKKLKLGIIRVKAKPAFMLKLGPLNGR